MNILLHFLVNYIIVESVFGNALNYVLIIFISSVIFDLDHISYINRFKHNIFRKKLGSECRTRFHELYGLAVYGVVLSAAFFFFDLRIVQIISVCAILHLATDFLVGRTRPFFPFSKREVFLNILPEKHRMKFEIITTTGLLLCLIV